MDKATKRQLKYLKFLLQNSFNDYKNFYLKICCGVDKCSDLSKEEAKKQIEKFTLDNIERDRNIRVAMEKIMCDRGQNSLFKN